MTQRVRAGGFVARGLAAGLLLAAAAGCEGGNEITGGDPGAAPGAPAGQGGAAAGGRGGGGASPAASGGAGGFSFAVPDAGVKSMPPPPSAVNNCGLTKFEPQRLPAELLLVLDRSTSMTDRLAGSGMQKWPEVLSALDPVIQRTQAGVHWGLSLFPAAGDCGIAPRVHADLAPNNHGPIMGTIRLAPPRGGTPTRLAVETATAHLKMRATPNPKYILLATDGVPTCRNGNGTLAGIDAPAALDAVSAAAAAGVPTFVVGVATAGTDAHQTLNEMALRGQRPRDGETRYFSVASRDELATALESITGQIASCTFQLNPPPPNPDSVAVDVDGMRVPVDPAKANGWAYGATNGSLQLYGAWCDRLKGGAAKNVQVIYGCPGMLIP
jgi:hypothetical protein